MNKDLISGWGREGGVAELVLRISCCIKGLNYHLIHIPSRWDVK